MVFAERLIDRCERLFRSGVVEELVVCDILGSREPDVSRIEPYLGSAISEVRMAAVRIIGEKGSVDSLLDAAIKEQNVRVLLEMMRRLGLRKGGVEALDRLLHHKNSIIREEAIAMFRRAGKTDSLFPLIFDEDSLVVQRIKRYINEQG
jgi:hypothetical protein